VLFGLTDPHDPATWQRYLENMLRKVLKIKGTPIVLEFKSKANPFEANKNELTQRQVQRKRRMMSFVKKKKK
ncbi:MAG: ribosome biogenesis GTPase Der, partial [Litorivicinus sp.]